MSTQDTPHKIVHDLERALADFESDDDDEMLKAAARIQSLIDAAKGQHDSLTAKAALLDEAVAALRGLWQHAHLCNNERCRCVDFSEQACIVLAKAAQTKPAPSPDA